MLKIKANKIIPNKNKINVIYVNVYLHIYIMAYIFLNVDHFSMYIYKYTCTIRLRSRNYKLKKSVFLKG